MKNVSRNKCIGCGICVSECEADAISIEYMIALIDEEKCVSCGTCIKVCPQNAIRKIEENLVIAVGTDEGKMVKSDNHVGMSKYFQIWDYSNGELHFREERENAKYKEDESKIHGDPGKAKATTSVLNDIDLLVGKMIGPNITRLNDKFVCAVVRDPSIEQAIKVIKENINEIIEEKNKKERNALILK